MHKWLDTFGQHRRKITDTEGQKAEIRSRDMRDRDENKQTDRHKVRHIYRNTKIEGVILYLERERE